MTKRQIIRVAIKIFFKFICIRNKKLLLWPSSYYNDYYTATPPSPSNVHYILELRVSVSVVAVAIYCALFYPLLLF